MRGIILVFLIGVVPMAFSQQPPTPHKTPAQHKADSISLLSAANASLYCRVNQDASMPVFRSGHWSVVSCLDFNAKFGNLLDGDVDLLLSVLDLRIDLEDPDPKSPTAYSGKAHLLPVGFQSPQPSSPPKVPQLTATEQVALQAISEKMKAAQDQADLAALRSSGVANR